MDAELADRLIEEDERNDELQRSVLATVLRPDWADDFGRTADVTLATRLFERFGDQAVLIAK